MRFLLCLFLGLLTSGSQAASPEAVYGSKGMVVSRSALASEAGIEIMRKGGNAVDAAVATSFALAVTYPSAGNLGGGGFVVLRLPDGEVIAQDHREVAPLGAHRDMYLDPEGNVVKGLSRNSHLASGVPGSVDGLLDLLERHGTLSRKVVMAPAIRLARSGFVLDHYLARHINRYHEAFKRHPASMKKFTSNGQPLQVGHRWRQPDLARTLQRISRRGRAGFYEGKTADLIVAEMQAGGGLVTHEDLFNYRSLWRKAVHGTYRGYDIWSMGPPSSGGVLLIQMLNMLEAYDAGALGWGSAELIHLMLEAERRAYADRAEHLGDPGFYDVPLQALVDKAYARERFADFDPARASDSNEIYAGDARHAESLETAHISVMDGDGMMVAITTTLNSPYGSKIVVPGTGMLLNNEMDDFSIKPNTSNQWDLTGRAANTIQPLKRMLSSMTPTIVTREGQPVLITGSPGGSTIITTTLQVLMNVLDHGMSIEDAVGMPRFHHQWKPDRVLHERHAFSPDTLEKLKSLGHRQFTAWTFGRGIGDANSIYYDDGVMAGVEDPRTAGGAVGY